MTERKRIIFITLILLLITIFVYFPEKEKLQYYSLFRYLYLIPITLSCFYYGLSGGVQTSLLASSIYVPLLASSFESGFSLDCMEFIFTIFLFNAFAMILGWLSEKEKKEREKYQKLYEITESITHKFDWENVFLLVMEKGMETIKSETGILFVFEDNEIKIKGIRGMTEEITQFENMFASYINKEGKPLIINNLDETEDSLQINKFMKTIMGVPLEEKGQLKGVVIFENKISKDIFTDEDIKILQDLFSQAKLAYSQIRSVHLEELNKLKSEFVYSVSHELFTPLTSIKGCIATLLKDEEIHNVEEEKEFYQIINSESDRLIRMVSNVLDVSKIEAGIALELNLEEVNLEELIRNVISSQRFYASRYNFEMNFPDNLSKKILTDKDKIWHILTNLLSNAIKYSSPHSKITVDVKEDEEYISISVKDEGKGIPENEIHNIFNKFVRVEDKKMDMKRRGTGIGLYITKYLVELMGGKIWAESEEGKGSKLTFTLFKNK